MGRRRKKRVTKVAQGQREKERGKVPKGLKGKTAARRAHHSRGK